MTNQVNFQPTEIWTPRSEDFDLGEEIEIARRNINSQKPEQLIHRLRWNVRHSKEGIVYAILKGERPSDYSNTDALVMFNPFANAATDNMLVRAEFIREVAKSANIRDDNEKLKPVIMLASPGISGSKLNLNRDDKRQIRHGNLGPAARELLSVVAGRKYGRIALLGFSQGADMAIAGAKNANPANLEITSLGVGDPLGVEERTRIMLGGDLMKSGKQFRESIKSGNIQAQDEAMGSKSKLVEDFVRFGVGAARSINWQTILKGMGHSSFEGNMQEILDDGTINKIVVGYGESSSIAKPKSIEPSLARLHEKVAGADNRLLSIRVEGKDHSWSDQLPLLAKLYLKALA